MQQMRGVCDNGMHWLQRGQGHRAIGPLTKAADLAKELGDRQAEGNAYGNLHTAYRFRSESE